jgi:hypothetical protein
LDCMGAVIASNPPNTEWNNSKWDEKPRRGGWMDGVPMAFGADWWHWP